MRYLSTLLATAGLALLLGGAWLLDPIEDHSTEAAQAAELEAAERQAAVERRRDLAAQAVCAERGSVNTAAAWMADGSLVCKTKRGRTIAIVAAGSF